MEADILSRFKKGPKGPFLLFATMRAKAGRMLLSDLFFKEAISPAAQDEINSTKAHNQSKNHDEKADHKNLLSPSLFFHKEK